MSLVSNITSRGGQPKAAWPNADRSRSAARMSFREPHDFYFVIFITGRLITSFDEGINILIKDLRQESGEAKGR